MKVEVLGKEFDLTQMFNGVTKYSQFTNLAFNPIVDATSYLTGVYNNQIDKLSGDFYSKEAANKATRENPKMVMEYLSESGKVQKNSKLNHLMEYFGIMNVNDRAQESSRNRLMRGLSKSAYAISKVANLPVTPKAMLAVIYDHKFVDGKFRSYNNFKKIRKAADGTVSEATLSAEWRSIKETLMDNLIVDETYGVRPAEKFMEKYPENSQEEFEKLSSFLSAKIGQVIQSVDSLTTAEDQTAAQRDVALNAFLMHRSWFIIKGRHFNLATGQIDEGHYKSALRFVQDVYNGKKQGRTFKSIIRDMEEHDRRNAKRFTVDLIGVAILTAMTMALLAADDEDDTLVEDIAQLLALRTTSEAESANFIGIIPTAVEMYQTPLIQLNNFEKISKAIGNKDRRGEFLLKATPGKRYYQLGDIQRQVDSFRHFNSSTLRFIGESDK